MKIVEHNTSSSRPAKILKGYSGTLYNTDIKEVVKEDGEIMYDFTSYFFDNPEYEFIGIGILPSGASWDDKLREIERSYLYDEADIQISKYSTDVKDDKMRAAWIEYKSKIRQSINQGTYPEKVIYPKIPTE